MPATLLVILVCCVVYVLEWRLPAARLGRLQELLGLRPVDVAGVWRALSEAHSVAAAVDHLGTAFVRALLPLLAHSFVYAGLLHLLADVAVLWVFGGRLEARTSSPRLLLFFMLAGLAGGIARVASNPTTETVLVGGSAAVAAIVVAYLVRCPRARVCLLVPVIVVPVLVELPAAVVAAAWVTLQIAPVQRLLALGAAEPVGWAGTAAGALAGLLLGPLLLRGPRGQVSRPV